MYAPVRYCRLWMTFWTVGRYPLLFGVATVAGIGCPFGTAYMVDISGLQLLQWSPKEWMRIRNLEVTG